MMSATERALFPGSAVLLPTGRCAERLFAVGTSVVCASYSGFVGDNGALTLVYLSNESFPGKAAHRPALPPGPQPARGAEARTGCPTCQHGSFPGLLSPIL